MTKNKTITLIRTYPQLVILIIMMVVLSFTTPNFATTANFMNILKQVSVISIIACGLTLVIIAGDLDLSVGSTLSLLCVVSATMQLRNDTLAIIVPLVLAVFVGLFNGLIVTSFDVNSIIVTLGSLSLFSGLALFYTNGAIILTKPGTWYSVIAQGKIVNVPIHVLVFIVVAIAYQILLKMTTFGRSLIYIGTNSEAAKIVGIRTRFIRTMAFIICSLSVAVAAVISVSRVSSGSPVAGVGFEFDAITAVVIGGTSLRGGKGSIGNTIVGVLLLAVIINALRLYNVPYAFQNITKGLLIIAAITIEVRSERKLES